MCFQRQKKVYLETCSAKRHVFPLRFIYSQAKCRRSLNFKLERQINAPINVKPAGGGGGGGVAGHGVGI